VLTLTDASLETALEDIASIGFCSVSYETHFGAALPGTISVALGDAFVTSTSDLRGYVAYGDEISIAGVTYTVGSPLIESQTITVSADGPVSAGDYSLTFGAETTACLAWDANRFEVEAALENLVGISR